MSRSLRDEVALKHTERFEDVPSIRDTLRGKVLLLTGGTGFMGITTINKLLKDCDVAMLYVMIRDQTERPAVGKRPGRPFVSAQDRLRKQMATDRAFVELRERHGANFESWWSQRMQAVPGDVLADRLGLSEQWWSVLSEELDLVIHTVASLEFTLPFDEAFAINVRGPTKVFELVKDTIQRSKRHAGRGAAIVHVSTCYSAGRFAPQTTVYENPHILNFDGVAMYNRYMEGEMTQREKELMFEPWPNSYNMSKAWAEVVMQHLCTTHRVPVCFFRPAAIGAAYKEPAPGWVNQLFTWGPLSLQVGAGRLTECMGASNCEIVATPVDYCINHMLAATPFLLSDKAYSSTPSVCFATHSSTTGGPGALMVPQFLRLAEDYFRAHPLPIQVARPGDPHCNFYNNFPDFWKHFNAVYDNKPKRGGSLRYMLDVFDYWLCHSWQFDRTVHDRLLKSVKGDEQRIFYFDYDALNPQHYLPIAFAGLAEHAFGPKWREQGKLRMQKLYASKM